MDFREAQLMTAVAEYGNITKAARALYMSQPALSHYVNKVEARLGVKLFDRSTNPLTLTFAGERYMETMGQMLRMNEQLTRQFRDISQNMAGRLRLGIPQERGAYMLPKLLPEFQRRYPGVEVQVFTASAGQLQTALERGRVDLLILPAYAPEALKGFCAEVLFQEELLLVSSRSLVTPDLLLPGRPDTADLSRFGHIPFYVLYESHAGRRAAERLFKQHRIKPKIALESSSNITCCRLAAAGLGAAIVPELTCRLTQGTQGELRCRLGVPPVTWPIAAYWRADAYLGKVERELIALIREEFSQT